ncbi:MAG: NAD(P)-dependent oxidoreductase [Alphaproteobacteria bacterium]
MTVRETIGFIGLGRMGGPMARNLAAKQMPPMVHDLSAAAMARIEAVGGTRAANAAELARAATVVFTMLPGPPEVDAVLLAADGAMANMKPGSLVVDMSTVLPETTDMLSKAAAARGLGFVDAPVGRLASHAERGESLFMVGASDGDFARVKPLLAAMGTTIHHCGPPGSGTRTKLINNLLAIVSCMMNAEALTLAKRFGLNIAKTLEVIHGTTATNGQLKLNYATKVFKGDIEPGFAIDLAHKDLSLIAESANRARMPAPIVAMARESLSLARAAGWGGKDFSALLDFWCERAGVDKVRL